MIIDDLEQAQAEIAEQHPELRIELFPSQAVHEQNRSRLSDSPGSYEWWSVQALDNRRNGIICEFHLGHIFDPKYRSAFRRFRAGQNVDLHDLRPTTYPAVRVTLLKRGDVLARSVCAYSTNSWRESSAHEAWSISIGPNRLAASGEGWLLSVNMPAQRMGFDGILHHNDVLSGARIRGEFDIQPCYETTLLSRAGLPDSPGGLTHNWLIASPSAFVTGHAEFLRPADTKRDRGSKLAGSQRLALHNAIGAIEHFWGRSLPGDGFRRRYGARLSWDQGAAIGDLVVIRKYIQIAPTLMIFRPESVPSILRCDRGPRSAFQRSKWLIGYPLEMFWQPFDPRNPSATGVGGTVTMSSKTTAGTSMTHQVTKLHEASPCQAFSATNAELHLADGSTSGSMQSHHLQQQHQHQPPKLIEGQGFVSLMTPARAGSFLWRRWCRSIHDNVPTM